MPGAPEVAREGTRKELVADQLFVGCFLIALAGLLAGWGFGAAGRDHGIVGWRDGGVGRRDRIVGGGSHDKY